MSDLKERLRALSADRLAGMRCGVEKESLRTDAAGRLATTPHPPELGSALTHPHITTDFSEAQLELITGVHASAETCVAELTRVHQAVYQALGEEMMWAGSMPGILPDDDSIPIGQYGSSNVGQAKSVYRAGLGHRYGRRMQTISGIHYNWSLPEVSSAEYFGLIRNFRRNCFLLLYLFGASPAVCSRFVEGQAQAQALQPLGDHTLHLPHATSLRMGRLGYQSDAQTSLCISYNNLESYAASLHDALVRPYPPYEAIGVRDAQGRYRQLATSLLQIENEFYGTIRPKRVIFSGERPLHALRERGVEYIEVRCMDLDPFEPLGISARTMRFIDIFLLHCLLADSPPDTPAEIAALGRNQHRVAAFGRQPGLRLEQGEREVPLVDWAAQLLDECGPIAARLDQALGGGYRGEHHGAHYSQALEAARQSLAHPGSLPSARVLDAMRDEFAGSHLEFVRTLSARTRASLLELDFTPEIAAGFRAVAEASLAEQRRIEAADTLPFEQYRLQYLAPERLGRAVQAW